MGAVDADSVVGNGEQKIVGLPENLYVDAPARRMLHAVRQRFLDGAIDARPMLIGQTVELAFHGEVDLQPIPPREIANVPFEGGLQPQIVEHARSQPERQVPYRAHHIVDELAPRRDGVGNGRIGRRAGTLDAAEFHAQSRQHLAYVIVKFA